MKKRAAPLSALIAELDVVIAAAEAAHLEETAVLLRIARLDLLLRVRTSSPGNRAFVAAVPTAGKSLAKPRKNKPVRRRKRTRD